MTCDQATFMLEQRLDNALSEEAEKTLDEHLATCAACRVEAEAVAVAEAAFVRLPDLAPPVDIAAAVRRRIAREAPAERGRRWSWVAIGGLAFVLAAVFSLGYTPAAVFGIPAVTAVIAPITQLVAEWIRPIVLPLRALSPAIGPLAGQLVILVVAEVGLVGWWMARLRQGPAALRTT